MSHLRIEGVGTKHLSALSLEVAEGECVGVSGPSGMGKSLFLRAIADLDPHEGQVWLDEQEQQSVPAKEWRAQVGLLASESAWWAEKLAAHFTDIETEALQQLGFERDCLEWSVERLSSGEKQRLALLRLLMMHPRVLLLDEPTANLDPDSVKKVESLIREYRRQQGAPVIWVSHDLAQIERVSERHYHLDKSGLHEVTTA